MWQLVRLGMHRDVVTVALQRHPVRLLRKRNTERCHCASWPADPSPCQTPPSVRAPGSLNLQSPAFMQLMPCHFLLQTDVELNPDVTANLQAVADALGSLPTLDGVPSACGRAPAAGQLPGTFSFSLVSFVVGVLELWALRCHSLLGRR